MSDHNLPSERPSLTDREQRSWWVFWALVLIIAAIVGAWGWVAWHKYVDGTFGDAFGGINALFSGLAFAGIIHAILLQRRELELQRRELEMTRHELKRAAEAQERSEQALRAETESHTRPLLKVTLEPDHWRRQRLSIINEGKTPAERVRLSVEPEVYLVSRSEKEELAPLSSLPLFMHDEHTISAGTSLVYALSENSLVAKASNNETCQPTSFTVTAKYRSRSGIEFTERTFLSPELIEGTWPFREPGELESISRKIGEIQRSMEKLVNCVKEGNSKVAEAVRSATRR